MAELTDRELKRVLGPVFFESTFNPAILSEEVRQESLDLVQAADAGELTRRQLRAQLRETAAERLGTAFAEGAVVYSNGANVGFSTWAEMYSRTATMDAMRSAQTQFATQNGMDLAKIRNDLDPCVECKPWNGRTVSISGATPGFPSLADARSAGWGHPNCGCIVIGLVPGEAEAAIEEAPLL